MLITVVFLHFYLHPFNWFLLQPRTYLTFPLTVLKFIIFFLQLIPFITSHIPCPRSSKSTPSCSMIYAVISNPSYTIYSKPSQNSLKDSLSSFILLHFLFQVRSSLIHPHHSFACAQISVPLCLLNHFTYSCFLLPLLLLSSFILSS